MNSHTICKYYLLDHCNILVSIRKILCQKALVSMDRMLYNYLMLIHYNLSRLHDIDYTSLYLNRKILDCMDMLYLVGFFYQLSYCKLDIC